MKFVTLFTRLENVHLLKDVGMIPYILHRDFGVDSTMVSFRNEESYPFLDKEVKGLKLKFLKKKSILSGVNYLVRESKNIDVLNVYHLNLSSFVYLLVYKFCKAKTGKSYLKLDMDLSGYDRLMALNPVGWIKRRTMDLSDMASVETTVLYEKLQKKYGEKICYIPNGFYCNDTAPATNFNKQNIILTVGNLGTYAKATENLLQAFAAVSGDNDWKLTLVGPVEESFNTYIRHFMKQHPDLSGRIAFTGNIEDKQELTRFYRSAKIFCLPSRSESFGIVLLEAAANGCFLVTTAGVPAGRDINNDGKFGFSVPVDDVAALSDSFLRLMNSNADWETRATEIADYIYHDFRWEPIVGKLMERLK